MKEAERSGNCSRKEAPWSAQYLPADNGEEERRVRMKWLGQEIADVLEREVVRGCRQGEEAEAGVKVGGTENLVGSASDDLGMDLKRSKKVFVQSSLFAGVMLNIQHKYGVDVGFVLEKLYPRDASKGQLQDLGMSGLQATGDQGDAAKAVPSTGEISAYQAGAVTNILDAGSMSGGQMRTRAQEEIQSMMSHWEKQYPGILSGKGRHLLSIDLQLMDDLEPMALRQLGLWDWDQSERQLTQVFGADLEMEAGRRRRCQQVFRGLDGSREILKMEDK
ncbi:hypothetical protein KVT40_005035 [Elsinoe batatas]|uniref:Uncharacterized protein n=1 Tax=Elsinoe batatas TaxID=2601811 RepID=A0A8K0L1X4_9PEZI|nr:hypothetical protein KVT40_005035 [Elsinoe batatas]